MVVGFAIPMQSVLITTNLVSSNPSQAGCTRYNITWSSLSVAVCRWFSRVLQFPPPTNKTDLHNVTERLLKVTLNTINYKPYPSNTQFVWSPIIGREDPKLSKCIMKTILRRIIAICLFQNLFSKDSEKGLKQDTIIFRVCCKDDSWFSA